MFGGGAYKRKYYLVVLYKIKHPFSNEGLGIRSIITFNNALPSKQKWGFLVSSNALWRRLSQSPDWKIMGGPLETVNVLFCYSPLEMNQW